MDDEPPSPAGAASLAELTGRLRALWSWAGRPSEAALRSLTRMRRTASGFMVDGMPPGTVERVLSGDEPVWESVEPFVVSCLRVGSRSQERIGLDVAAWQEAWRAVAPLPRSRPPATGSIFGTRRVATWRRAWLAVRGAARSVWGGSTGERPRDPGTVGGRGAPAWRSAMLAAAAFAVVFALGGWVMVSAGGSGAGRPPPASRSAAPGQSGTASPGASPATASPGTASPGTAPPGR